MRTEKPTSEVGVDIHLRKPENHRHRARGPQTNEDDRATLGEFYDGAFADVILGEARIWTRNPETFEALAIALKEAAAELRKVRHQYYAEQPSEPESVGV